MAYKDDNKRKANQAAWRAANKLHIKAYNKAWREEHKDHLKEYHAAYFIQNKTRMKEYAQDYKRLNQAQIKAVNDIWNDSPEGKFSRYKSRAKERHIVWNLTFEQFCSYWQKTCHYCGCPVETIGLDRYNSELGYWESNVVPCCWPCNASKNDAHGDDFIQDMAADKAEIEEAGNKALLARES